jgi:hypothetical protein
MLMQSPQSGVEISAATKNVRGRGKAYGNPTPSDISRTRKHVAKMNVKHKSGRAK